MKTIILVVHLLAIFSDALLPGDLTQATDYNKHLLDAIHTKDLTALAKMFNHQKFTFYACDQAQSKYEDFVMWVKRLSVDQAKRITSYVYESTKYASAFNYNANVTGIENVPKIWLYVDFSDRAFRIRRAIANCTNY